MRNRCRIAKCVIFLTSTVVGVMCQLTLAESTATHRLFPVINYDNQSPFGTHEVSISHKGFDQNAFVENNIEVHDFIVGEISRRILSRYSSTSIQRDLGDFDDLNNLFKGVTISLPDINKIDAGKYLLSHLFIWARNMVCSNISIGNIVIHHGMKNDKEYDFSLDIEDLAISCDMDWRYEYSFFSGEGSAQVYTTKSDASIAFQFKSTDFDVHPPSAVESTDCATAIEIDKLDIQGGIVASVVSLFKDTLVDAIEGAINGVACEELNSIGANMLGSVVTEVARLLEQFLPENSPPVDFLLPEKKMTVPPGVEILNFSRLGSETGNWFELLLQLVDDVLGVSPNGTDFKVNQLLRSTILDDDRILQVPLSVVIFDGHDMLTETIIELTHVRLIGLDTFNTFDSLERAGNHTLFNHFSWAHLDVEMDFNLTIKPSSRDDSIINPGETVEEQMTITVGIDEIDVDFHLLLAIDKHKVGTMQLGSLFNASNIVPCILDTMHHVEIAGFVVDAKAIDVPTLSGFISPGIDKIMTNTADAVFNMYEPVLVKAIPNIFQLTVTKVLNELIQTSFSGIDPSCPITNFPSNKTFINFGDLLLSEEGSMVVGGTGTTPYGHIIRDIMNLVKEEFLKFESDGRSILNEMVISKLTEKQSGTPGTISIPDEFGAAMILELGEFVADLEFKVSNTTINNIDSIGSPLIVLEPISPQVLNNTVGLGVGPDSLRGSTILTIGFADGFDVNLRNVVELSVDVRGVVDAAAQLSIIENALLNFPIQDMLNLNCWLNMMPAPVLDTKGVRIPSSETSMALKDLVLAMSTLNLNVKCIECSSPLLEELAPLLSSDEAVGEITDLMNNVLDYITNLLGGTFLQVQLDRMLAQAPLKCPHSVSYDDNRDNVAGAYDSFTYQKQAQDSLTFLFVVLGIVGGSIVVILITYVTNQVLKRSRQNIFIAGLSDDEIASLQIKQQREIETQNRLNAETKAMYMSKSIPLVIRVLIPIVVLANIGFFLSGHLSLGASVGLDVQIAGEAVRVDELFVFSMAESVVDMWEAGAKELAIMILMFSGLWPYTKQLAVLLLWFAPPRIVSVGKRESIFIWLDRLGKWSFVDIFVLILSLSSFRVSINTPDNVSYLPEDFLKLDLLVIPCWGLYSNMIAQFISQINSHIIIHFHRKIKFDHDKKVSIEEPPPKAEDTSPLYKHTFRDTFAKTTLHLRSFANIVVIFLATSFVVLIIVGCIIPSYSLEQFGLVGLASSKPFVEHDIFSTMKLLADQASFTGSFTDRIGLSILSSVLLLTVLIVPLVQLALLLYRWFRPMSKKTRFRIFVAIEALAAWQYIEVYLLSIIVASWQLGGVSEFLINDYCGGLEDTFAMLQYYGILGVNESQCFRVSARLQSATWILIASSIVLSIVNHIISSAALQQEEDLKMSLTSSSHSSSFDDHDVLPNNLTDDGEETNGRRFHRLHLLEAIRFSDCYSCFLQQNSDHSYSGDEGTKNNEPSSPKTVVTSFPSPDKHGMDSGQDFAAVPYKGYN